MSPPGRKRTALETLEALDRQAAEDEMDRILALSDAEIDAELAAEGFDPTSERAEGARMGEQLASDALAAGGAAVAAEGAGEAVPKIAKVVSIARPRRSAFVVWLVAAAFAALVGLIGVTQGAAIATWFKGKPEPVEPILPDNEKAAPPTPHELAEKMRDEADTACANAEWGTCMHRLDDAKKLDPAGESEDRVKRLRDTIHENTTIPPGPGPKDKGPWKPGR
jgi:hypothetical protein